MSSNDEEYQRMLRNMDAARLADSQEPPMPNTPPQPQARVRMPLFTPWAMRALLVMNVTVFSIPWLLGMLGITFSGNVSIYDVLLVWGAKENAAIYSDGQYYRFITAMFLHGGLAHLFFNSFALYSIGGETERIYGTWRFLALYFIAGIGGGVLSYAFNPNPSVGASGAIFGLVGALSAFYYVARRVLGGIARQQLGSLMFIIMINLALGFSTPYIDNNAHIGGLLTGALVGWALAPRFMLDTRAYPPTLARVSLKAAWPAAVVALVALVVVVSLITPPLS